MEDSQHPTLFDQQVGTDPTPPSRTFNPNQKDRRIGNKSLYPHGDAQATVTPRGAQPQSPHPVPPILYLQDQDVSKQLPQMAL